MGSGYWSSRRSQTIGRSRVAAAGHLVLEQVVRGELIRLQLSGQVQLWADGHGGQTGPPASDVGEVRDRDCRAARVDDWGCRPEVFASAVDPPHRRHIT